LRNSIILYTKKENGDYQGCILVLRSSGAGINRYYVKVVAKNSKIAEELVIVLIWNFHKELFIKMRKDNKFLSAFKKKGFRFQGSRGIQLLLKREKSDYEYKQVLKEEDRE
jgi:hypothetical protein